MHLNVESSWASKQQKECLCGSQDTFTFMFVIISSSHPPAGKGRQGFPFLFQDTHVEARGSHGTGWEEWERHHWAIMGSHREESSHRKGHLPPWASDLSLFKWHGRSTPVFLLGKSHGQGSLVGYSPRGRKESDATEHTHASSYRDASGFWTAHSHFLGVDFCFAWLTLAT